MNQGNGYDTRTHSSSNIYIEIDWVNGKVIGNGVLSGMDNYNVSFLMNSTLTAGVNTILGTVNQNGYVATPRLIIDYPNKQIIGLPLCNLILRNQYRNSSVQISLVQTNLI